MSDKKDKKPAMLRRIELKVFSSTDDDVGLNYRDNIIGLLKSPRVRPGEPGAGADAAEMAQVLPILGKVLPLDDDDELLLDEGEWKILRDRAKSFKYGQNSQVIEDFYKYLQKADKVPMKIDEDAEVEETTDEDIADEEATDTDTVAED